MSDLTIPVKSAGFLFNPTELMVRVIGQNVPAKETFAYFELKDGSLDNSRYINREWVDKGNVNLPSTAFVAAFKEDGSINVPVMNAVLAAFNLQVDEEAISKAKEAQ